MPDFSKQDMDEIDDAYRCGQHSAIRGMWRVLCNAPSQECFDAWYAGFDSVPRELRRTGPLTGPIPQEILEQLGGLTPTARRVAVDRITVEV
jgi:hypothetical protein